MILLSDISQSGFRIVIMLIILSGIAFLLISPVSADASGSTTGKPVVTIMAQGSQSYYLGEKVSLKGQNTDSDSTYLFITGPNIPDNGGKLTAPQQGVVSGNPDRFTVVRTKADNTWEYSFYTANLPYDAGSYTLYAVGKPAAEKQFDNLTTYGTVSIILKRPFITADISSQSIVQGQPFAITGTAEGVPPEVQIWLIGDTYALTTKTPVHADASFTLNADAALSGKLPKGQNYLLVQHPMQNNRFDIDVSGEYVRSLTINNGTNLFRITGPGSMQGGDAADALTVALGAQGSHDDTYTHDTYTIVPFQVTDAVSPTLQAPAATTAPVQQTTQHAPLQYALIGALALVTGMAVWRRQ